MKSRGHEVKTLFQNTIPACKPFMVGASSPIMPFYIYAITVFAGSFLLFAVQPMVAKELLPVYGGSAMVWGSVMFFFQCMVLCGYLWAHFIMRMRRKSVSDLLHCAILFTPLLPIIYGSWQAGAAHSETPVIGILQHLFATIGLPVFILCTMSVTLQHWLTRTDKANGTDTYRLYAYSNAGSLIALLAYPVMLEPLIALPMQRVIWWWILAATVLLNLLCCPFLLKWRRGLQKSAEKMQYCGDIEEAPAKPPVEVVGTEPDPPNHRLSTVIENGGTTSVSSQRGFARASESKQFYRFPKWVLTAAAPCALMVAFTHHITRNLAAVPFLWIMPLAIYLLTFIVAFRRKPVNTGIVTALLPWLVLIAFLLHGIESFQLSLPAIPLLLLAALTLGGLCLNCTIKLSASRPTDDTDLSLYYLAIAIGGCIGGAVTGWLPPVLTNTTIEMPLAVALVCLACAKPIHNIHREKGRNHRQLMRLAANIIAMLSAWLLLPLIAGHLFSDNTKWTAIVFALCAAIFCFSVLTCRTNLQSMAVILSIAAVFSVHTETLLMGAGVVLRGRNYYGMYRVLDRNQTRYLQHEGTLHGRESLMPGKQGIPLGYYHRLTPAGEITANPPMEVNTIGMIGLGTGALAAHCQTDQTLHIIEIDPDIPHIADKYFTFLDKARSNGAKLHMHNGDGRRVLQHKFNENSLDLLILDAFSGGAIPVHLLTAEAFLEYARVLKPDGILLVHISNRYLNLAPVIVVSAEKSGLRTTIKTASAEISSEFDSCTWAALTINQHTYMQLITKYGWLPQNINKKIRPWTDNFSNLLHALW